MTFWLGFDDHLLKTINCQPQLSPRLELPAFILSLHYSVQTYHHTIWNLVKIVNFVFVLFFVKLWHVYKIVKLGLKLLNSLWFGMVWYGLVKIVKLNSAKKQSHFKKENGEVKRRKEDKKRKKSYLQVAFTSCLHLSDAIFVHLSAVQCRFCSLLYFILL